MAKCEERPVRNGAAVRIQTKRNEAKAFFLLPFPPPTFNGLGPRVVRWHSYVNSFISKTSRSGNASRGRQAIFRSVPEARIAAFLHCLRTPLKPILPPSPYPTTSPFSILRLHLILFPLPVVVSSWSIFLEEERGPGDRPNGHRRVAGSKFLKLVRRKFDFVLFWTAPTTLYGISVKGS